jgi:putative SOS response-associated peptidase YedK
MCGRFALKSPNRIKLDYTNQSGLRPLQRYNIAPSQTIIALFDRVAAGVHQMGLPETDAPP